MAALDDIGNRTKTLVVGTTGFSPEEETRLQGISRQLPVMISANFAETFEPFIQACRTLAASYPEHVPQLEETYHQRKKAVPSGTSLRVRREIMDARRIAGSMTARPGRTHPPTCSQQSCANHLTNTIE